MKAEYDKKLASADGQSDDESIINKLSWCANLIAVFWSHAGIVDAYHDEYLEQLAEITEEEPPELEEDEEEETEIEAVERMKSAIIEQFEEQIELISLLQVCV